MVLHLCKNQLSTKCSELLLSVKVILSISDLNEYAGQM